MTQPSDPQARIEAANEEIVAGVTYNEAHAALLGLVGILAGAAWASGLTTVTLAVSGVLMAAAFGVRKLPADHPTLAAMNNLLGQLLKGVVGRTLRREPWWFTTIYILTAALTWVVL